MASPEPTAPSSGGGVGGEVTVAGTNPFAGFQFGHASAPSTPWRRSMRRKMDMREHKTSSLSSAGSDGAEIGAGIARVEIENEASALREALISHQQSVQNLQIELEEERSAAASAATEAMSMILRLQHEKAEAQMEARQFKRLAEEKMSHDQQEIATLEDLVFKRDQAVQALSCEIQAYRHRLLSYGIQIDSDMPPSEPQTPDTATSSFAIPQFDLPQEYPPLRCTADPCVELDKYPSGETPREHFQKLEQRIFQLERMPSSGFGTVMDKGVVVVPSPRTRPRHIRTFSYSSYASGLEFDKVMDSPVAVDRRSDYGERDDMSDRIYTVDAVHGASEDYVSTPREFLNKRLLVGDVGEAEIKKLYIRLQALEADRESMRQTLISMGTDKAQMVILKEIAQRMCNEGPLKESIVVKKPSFAKRFSFMSIIKSVISFVFWRNRSSRVKFSFGLSTGNVGLLLLLDKSPRMRHRRVLTRTQG